ncbi:MAG: hypothetical protein PHG67_11080 [Bacteroidales bacterium]|nr:hypothetical protein [Bacteroidales bacterium]
MALAFQLNAQQLLTVKEVLALDLSQDPKSASRNKQWIYFNVINDQQKGEPLLPASWEIILKFKLEGTAYQTTLVSLQSENITATNHMFYRGMRIDDVVQPDIISARIVLKSRQGSSWEKLFDQQISEKEWFQISHVDLYAPEQELISAKITGFDFSEKTKKQIEERIRLINRFFASLHLFEDLLQASEPDHNITDLFLEWDKLRKAVAAFDQDYQMPGTTIHTKSLTDWQKKFEGIQRKKLRYQTLLDQMLNGNESLDASNFIVAYTTSLQNANDHSLRVDFRDQEAYQILSVLHADEEFLNILERISATKEIPLLKEMMADQLLYEADKLLTKQDYANAHNLLNSLYISGLAENITQEQRVLNKLTKAQKGVLEAFFDINIKALETGNTEMANNYYAKSLAFYEQSFRKIPDDDIRISAARLINAYEQVAENKVMADHAGAIRDLFKALQTAQMFDNRTLQESVLRRIGQLSQAHLDELTNQIEQQIQTNHLQQAYIISKNADQYISSQPDISLNIDLLEEQKQKLRSAQHVELLTDEMQTIKTDPPSVALKKLYAAQIADTEQFSDQNAEQLILARKLIIEKIRSANQSVWANELDNAWKIYNEASEFSAAFKLTADKTIQEEFSRLDAKIIERICLNEKNRFDQLMLEADRALRFKRIHDLKELTTQARELVDKNRGCGIETGQLEEYEQGFKETFSYWEALQEVLNKMYSQGFDVALPYYLKLDEDVKSMDLSALGNPHQDMFVFLTEQQNPLLTALAVDYFIRNNDQLSAVRYFKLLVDQQPKIDQFEKLMEQAARFFAQYDAQHLQNENYNILIQQYVPDDKIYKVFVRTYKRHFSS